MQEVYSESILLHSFMRYNNFGVDINIFLNTGGGNESYYYRYYNCNT